jgi:hypothetical protein
MWSSQFLSLGYLPGYFDKSVKKPEFENEVEDKMWPCGAGLKESRNKTGSWMIH